MHLHTKQKQTHRLREETYDSVQFSSVAQLCLTLCDPMNRSSPGLPVHHRLPEFTQTHAHREGGAIQSLVDHILSDLSTMTHLSWMAPHSMA